MFYSVRGKLIHTTPSTAVVECGGVGYNCQTTINTLKQIKPNTEVTSGVGPKAGLAILSELSPEQVAMAIASNDVKTITRAQGVGKKIAQRIILELKDKLAKAMSSSEDMSAVTGAAAAVATGNVSKAIEALGVLGYAPSEVSPVLAQFDSSLPVEQLIAMTLRQMGRK